MNRIEELFLSIIHSSLHSQTVGDDPKLDEKDWQTLLTLAAQQNILPLIFHSVCHGDSLKAQTHLYSFYRNQSLTTISHNVIRVNEFLTLLLHAQSHGLDPIVLKGIICRNLFPQPYLRPSVDEDILISLEDAEEYHKFLISEGLFSDKHDADPKSDSELSYHKENSPTYIEMQKALFNPDSELFGDFNKLFDGIMDRTIHVQIEDVSVCTLAPTDHLLYLILHAFKHFVHSGIGIRAVCDIGMFAEHYASEIDWQHIRKCLTQVHAFDFARALFHIIKPYLLPNAEFFNHILDWHIEEIDVEPLLEDILAGGVHGNSSLERLHSSNITLDAIAKDKKETPGFLRAALHSIFLPLDKMSGRYPYLKKAPFLLPVAWGQRIGGYLKERAIARQEQHQSGDFVNSKHKAGAAESIRLGQSRVELLRMYGIIR